MSAAAALLRLPAAAGGAMLPAGLRRPARGDGHGFGRRPGL